MPCLVVHDGSSNSSARVRLLSASTPITNSTDNPASLTISSSARTSESITIELSAFMGRQTPCCWQDTQYCCRPKHCNACGAEGPAVVSSLYQTRPPTPHLTN